MYLVDCVLRTGIYRSSISLDLRRSLGLPRRRSTSYRWISRAFPWSRHVAGFPALSDDYVVSLGFPRFSLAFATSLEIPALSGFPALSVDYVASLEFPRFRRSARSRLDLPRLL